MTFDQWIAIAAIVVPVFSAVTGAAATAAWRTFRRIEKRIDELGALGTRIDGIDNLLWFHHEILDWENVRIKELERKSA